MRQPTAILSLLASSVCAADIVSFYFPGGYEGVDPVATLNTVKPTLTEFHIACPTGVDSADCGWGPGLDATILSQTRYQATMDAGSVSMSLGCDYDKKKVEMTCTVNQEGGNDDTGGKPVTAVFSGQDVKFLSLTVVAGNSLLRPQTSATPSATPSATTTKTSAQPTTTATLAMSASTGLMTASNMVSATASPVSTSGAQTAPTSSNSSAAPPESTGAATRFGIEGSALLMLAGAAALNVW